MMEVRAMVARDGDGWLSANVHEWVTVKLGVEDQQFTESLGEWDPPAAASPPRIVAGWARDRFDEVTGIDGEPDPVTFDSRNCHHLLTDDLTVTLMNVRHGGETMTLAVVDHQFVHVLAPCREWSDAVDWSAAWGNCPNGHPCTVEGAHQLRSGTDGEPYRVTDQCRLGDADPYEGGYIACPHCDEPIRFDIW